MSDAAEALATRYRRAARERTPIHLDRAILALAAQQQRRRVARHWCYAAGFAVLASGLSAYQQAQLRATPPSVPEFSQNGLNTVRARLYLLSEDFSLAARSEPTRQLLQPDTQPDPYLPSS